MNLTKLELEDLLYNIKEIINYIEKSNFDKRRFKIYLTNGEDINFSVPKVCIPHLLGVNIPYLSSTKIFTNNNAFNLLKKIASNSDKIWKYYRQGIITFDQLFSPFVFKKVDNFRENIRININDVEFICKYNSEKSYINNDNFENCDYLIFKKLDNDKYVLLTLVRNAGYFTPMSSQIFDDYESAKESLSPKLKHQDITLMSCIKIYFNDENSYYDEDMRNFYLNTYAKKQKLNKLFEYKKDFDCSTDVLQDYIFTLTKSNQNKNNQIEMNSEINTISSLIEKGEIIDISNVDSVLKPIIDAYNNIVCSLYTGNDTNQKNYTEIKEKLKELKIKLTKESKISKEKEEENTTLRRENKTLSEENSNLKDYLKDFHEKTKIFLK